MGRRPQRRGQAPDLRGRGGRGHGEERGLHVERMVYRAGDCLRWLLVAEKRFRRLDAPHLLKDVFEGRKFEDGKPVSTQQRKNAA